MCIYTYELKYYLFLKNVYIVVKLNSFAPCTVPYCPVIQGNSIIWNCALGAKMYCLPVLLLMIPWSRPWQGRMNWWSAMNLAKVSTTLHQSIWSKLRPLKIYQPKVKRQKIRYESMNSVAGGTKWLRVTLYASRNNLNLLLCAYTHYIKNVLPAYLASLFLFTLAVIVTNFCICMDKPNYIALYYTTDQLFGSELQWHSQKKKHKHTPSL